LKSTWKIVSTLAQHVDVTLRQRSSNDQNYAIVCPIVNYLQRHLHTVWVGFLPYSS